MDARADGVGGGGRGIGPGTTPRRVGGCPRNRAPRPLDASQRGRGIGQSSGSHLGQSRGRDAMSESQTDNAHAFRHTLTVFSVAAGMIGVSLTAIGLVKVLSQTKGVETLCDDLIAINAMVFGLTATGVPGPAAIRPSPGSPVAPTDGLDLPDWLGTHDRDLCGIHLDLALSRATSARLLPASLRPRHDARARSLRAGRATHRPAPPAFRRQRPRGEGSQTLRRSRLASESNEQKTTTFVESSGRDTLIKGRSRRQ